jgi:peptidyl-prolyl cis-trans isomerase C
MKASTLAVRLSSVAVALALLGPAVASAQNIAIVNGKGVPKSRVETLIKQVGSRGQQLPPDVEQRARDQVVMSEILTQEAERRGLAGGADYKNEMDLARQSILVSALFRDFEKKNPVTDAEVKAEYDKYRAQAGDKEYHVRHILVEKEDDAKALIAQIKGGAKFEDIAKKNSKDPGSAQNGGDLDWASPGSYVPEFSQAMVKLTKGQMTDAPVQSQFGWHIIKLDDVRDATFPSLEEVKPQIQQRLTQQKLASFRDDLKNKAKTDYKFGASN